MPELSYSPKNDVRLWEYITWNVVIYHYFHACWTIIKSNTNINHHYSLFTADTHITRALKGIASQISTLREYKAQLAMDGNADNILAHNSCSVTDNETDPWWMVTFGDIVRFYGVEIVSADNGKFIIFIWSGSQRSNLLLPDVFFYCCLFISGVWRYPGGCGVQP